MTLYTTHCPVCTMLEKALQAKGIQYEVCDDVPTMEALGIETVPVLKIGDEMLQYKDAMKRIMEPAADTTSEFSACETCHV